MVTHAYAGFEAVSNKIYFPYKMATVVSHSAKSSLATPFILLWVIQIIIINFKWSEILIFSFVVILGEF